MLSKKEQACIECIVKYREEKLLSQLRELTVTSIIRNSPLRYVFDVDKPRTTSVKTRNEKLLFPCVIALKLLIVLSFPLYFLLVLVSRFFNKRSLKTEIKKVRLQLLSGQSCKNKDLESLWRVNGFDHRECTEDERLAVLKEWIQALYGIKTLDELGLDNMFNEVKGLEARMNAPRNVVGGEGVPHFTLSLPVDMLVDRLSTELPAYE